MSSNRITLVQIQAAIGLPLTATFITETLGVGPTETEKRAMFWSRDQYGLIHGRLQNYLNGRISQNPLDYRADRPKKEEKAEAAAPAAAPAEDFFGGDSPEADASDFFNDAPAEPATEDFFS